MKQNFLGYLLIAFFPGKHTLKLSLLCCEVSQTICNNNYFENDLLFLLPLCNGLWFFVIEEFPESVKIFQVAKEDY
jgi:hypothetical protein